jgi:hypothetical protein
MEYGHEIHVPAFEYAFDQVLMSVRHEGTSELVKLALLFTV